MTSSVSRRHPCHTSHASPSPNPATPISFSSPPLTFRILCHFFPSRVPCGKKKKKKEKNRSRSSGRDIAWLGSTPAVSKVNLPSCVCPSLEGSICHFILVFSQPMQQHRSTTRPKTSELKISAAYQYRMSPSAAHTIISARILSCHKHHKHNRGGQSIMRACIIYAYV